MNKETFWNRNITKTFKKLFVKQKLRSTNSPTCRNKPQRTAINLPNVNQSERLLNISMAIYFVFPFVWYILLSKNIALYIQKNSHPYNFGMNIRMTNNLFGLADGNLISLAFVWNFSLNIWLIELQCMLSYVVKGKLCRFGLE